MTKPKYNMSNLSFQSAQVKRTIISRAKKGLYLDKRLSKTETLKLIATRLKLRSHRSFYDGENREKYLNDWFDNIVTEINDINMRLTESVSYQEKNDFKNMEELLIELNQERMLRKVYETRTRNLMEENEKLRINNLNLFKEIDMK